MYDLCIHVASECVYRFAPPTQTSINRTQGKYASVQTPYIQLMFDCNTMYHVCLTQLRRAYPGASGEDGLQPASQIKHRCVADFENQVDLLERTYQTSVPRVLYIRNVIAKH